MLDRPTRLARGAAATAGLGVLIIGAGTAAATSPRPGDLAPTSEPYAPKIDPTNFVASAARSWLAFSSSENRATG